MTVNNLSSFKSEKLGILHNLGHDKGNIKQK